MVQKSTPTLADLFLVDETAWLDATAELIRSDRLSDLDYPHLAEFLDDMATRDRREVESRLKVLLIHVLKWVYQKEMRSSSWETTVLNQQDELDGLLASGVLRNHAEQALQTVYPKAAKRAARETKRPVATFPQPCPWTLDELLAEEVLDQ